MIGLPPTSGPYRPRPTNPTLRAKSDQTSEWSVEGRGPRPAQSQPEYELHVECMHGVFPSVRAPARFVCFPSAGPCTRSVHHRDCTCTRATNCHWGGTAPKVRWLRRNIFGAMAASAAPSATITNKNAAKHEFMSSLITKWSQSIKTLYALKYAQ